MKEDYYSNQNYSIGDIIYLFSILIIYILSNLIEGATHLLSCKIIPSFVKICHINNKYFLSYSTVIGKTIGGLIYSVLCLMDESFTIKEIDIDNNPFSQTYIFQKDIYIFCSITIISFFILCFCYKSLRVRAISKLFYIND